MADMTTLDPVQVTRTRHLASGLPSAFIVNGQRIKLSWRWADGAAEWVPFNLETEHPFKLAPGQRLDAVEITCFTHTMCITLGVTAAA